MTPKLRRAAVAVAIPAVLSACTHRIAVDPIKVEPIDITLHIYLEADEKLDSFFNYQEQAATPPPAPPAPPADPPLAGQAPSEGGTP